MITRETSREAYDFIRECGWIGTKQKEIYFALSETGPSTSAEVFRHILDGQRGRNVLTQTRARFTELREMGAIEENGTRACSVTGRNAIVWQISNRIPTRLERKKKTVCLHCDGKGFV